MNEFRRMMQRVLKNKLPEQLLIILMVMLIAGLLFSRALLSISSVGLGVLFIISSKRSELSVPLSLAVALIFFPVAISGYWSDDKDLWMNSVSVKIPLLTMLLGTCTTTITRITWQRVILVYLLAVTAGCCYSLYYYWLNYDAVQLSYLQAKVISTPADNDYVRFSWMVVTAVFLGIKYILLQPVKWLKRISAAMVLFLIIYLHILAAKTGLLCLYAGGFIYLLMIAGMQKKWKHALASLAVIITVALLSYAVFPTLRNRVQYVVYDFSNYSKGNFMPGYNDAARWLSLKAGYAIMKEQPLSGVGFGDIHTAVNHWHTIHHPASFAYERFSPTNQWLVYGAGSGWPGMLVFTMGMAILFYYTTAREPLSVILSAVTCIPFLTDDSLEGQYGVILLAFIAFFGQQKFSKNESAV